jgi:hypothetical protein
MPLGMNEKKNLTLIKWLNPKLKSNRLSKSARVAHLRLLESIFINYNICWLSFALDTGFFLTRFSTCSTSILPFYFIIVLGLDLRHWRIMLEIGPSKSSWRNASPLLIGCCSFFSSTSICGCPSTTGCYNSPSSIGLHARIDCEISSITGWGLISTSSSKSK